MTAPPRARQRAYRGNTLVDKWRWFPYLGLVNEKDAPDLVDFLQLDPGRGWKVFVFDWLWYTYAFFAYCPNKEME